MGRPQPTQVEENTSPEGVGHALGPVEPDQAGEAWCGLGWKKPAPRHWGRIGHSIGNLLSNGSGRKSFSPTILLTFLYVHNSSRIGT